MTELLDSTLQGQDFNSKEKINVAFYNKSLRDRAVNTALHIGSIGLKLYRRGESPVAQPSNFLNVNWSSLEKDRETLINLVHCYQNVFGSDEKARGTNSPVWGEGAYCINEGRDKLIPLPQYKEQLSNGNNKCTDCGSPLAPCYPDSDVEAAIHRELTSSESSFITIMKGDSNTPVAGFSWGAVCHSAEELGERLIDTRYPDNPKRGVQVADPLVDKLLKNGVTKVLFFDEMGIVREFRAGIDPVRFLARDGLEMAHDNGVRKAMFWTSTKSPIFRITTSMGFRPVMDADGLTFLINDNIEPLLKIVQNRTEAEIYSQMRKGSKNNK